MTKSDRKTRDMWGLFLESIFFFLCYWCGLCDMFVFVTLDCHCLSFVKVLRWKQGCGLRKGKTLIKNSCRVDQWKEVFHWSAGSYTGLGPMDMLGLVLTPF